MTVQSTSREAYSYIKPTKNTECLKMLTIYREIGRPVCDKEFGEISGWARHIICARRNDLMNKMSLFGKPNPDIELKFKVVYEGMKVNHYGVVMQEELF